MKKLFILVIVLVLLSVVGAGIYLNKDKILGSIPPVTQEQPSETPGTEQPSETPGTEEPGETPGTQDPEEEKPVSFGIVLDNEYIYF